MFIRQQLQQKGLSEALVEQDLEAVKDEWFYIAEKVYKKKFSTQKITDQKEKAKRIRFMQSRGFLSDHYMGLLELVAC